MERSTYFEHGLEQRMQPDLRKLIDQYIAIGWKVKSRDPLIIERGRLKKIYENGILKDYTQE